MRKINLSYLFLIFLLFSCNNEFSFNSNHLKAVWTDNNQNIIAFDENRFFIGEDLIGNYKVSHDTITIFKLSYKVIDNKGNLEEVKENVFIGRIVKLNSNNLVLKKIYDKLNFSNNKIIYLKPEGHILYNNIFQQIDISEEIPCKKYSAYKFTLFNNGKVDLIMFDNTHMPDTIIKNLLLDKELKLTIEDIKRINFDEQTVNKYETDDESNLKVKVFLKDHQFMFDGTSKLPFRLKKILNRVREFASDNIDCGKIK